MTLAQLAMTVSAELTSSCVLPVTTPPKEIERIIHQSEKWFFKNYQDAVEERLMVIPIRYFQTPQFKQNRQFTLDDCVIALVDAPREMKGGGLFLTFDKDISDDRFIASEIFMSPNNGDQLVSMAARFAFWDLSKAFMIDTLAFTFNENTKRLFIKGRDPQYDVVIRYAAKIPEEKLYDDFYFQRYVTAKAKISLANILGTYAFNLIGGVSINYSDIKADGKEELTEIKEEIAAQSTVDWFFTYH
jgi:hypothetical protein